MIDIWPPLKDDVTLRLQRERHLDKFRRVTAIAATEKFKAYSLFLLIAFGVAGLGNYQKGEDLRRICELLEERLPAGYSRLL